MSKNYAMVNGVRIELPDDVDELTFTRKTVEEKKKSPFERVEKGSEYFYVQITGNVISMCEDNSRTDKELLSVANYCTDKEKMEQRALHETLNRLLWRYSEEHGGDKEWNGYNRHWFIYNNQYEEVVAYDWRNTNILGAVYFTDKETALNAVKEIIEPFMKEHPEFVW